MKSECDGRKFADGVGGENETSQTKVLCGGGGGIATVGSDDEMKCLKENGFFSLLFLIVWSARASANASVSSTGIGVAIGFIFVAFELSGSSGVSSFVGLLMNCLKENGFCSTFEGGK